MVSPSNPASGSRLPICNLARVTKPIRMRVRRTCHRCDTTFGPDKVCVNCQHPRCKKCPRFPPYDQDKDAEQPRIPKPPKIAEIRALHHGPPPNQHFKWTGDPNAPLKVQSRSGGQDLIRKTVRQRVRRNCHSCGTTFASGSKECENCKHVRCKNCPRDPARLDKHPYGLSWRCRPASAAKAEARSHLQKSTPSSPLHMSRLRHGIQ